MSSVERAALSAQREQRERARREKVVRCHGDRIHRATSACCKGSEPHDRIVLFFPPCIKNFSSQMELWDRGAESVVMSNYYLRCLTHNHPSASDLWAFEGLDWMCHCKLCGIDLQWAELSAGRAARKMTNEKLRLSLSFSLCGYDSVYICVCQPLKALHYSTQYPLSNLNWLTRDNLPGFHSLSQAVDKISHEWMFLSSACCVCILKLNLVV